MNYTENPAPESEEAVARLFRERGERDAEWYREGRRCILLFTGLAIFANVAVFLGFVVFPAMAR